MKLLSVILGIVILSSSLFVSCNQPKKDSLALHTTIEHIEQASVDNRAYQGV